MCQKLTDRNSFLALLRELRPVRAHTLLVVEPSARVRNGKGHRRQTLGRRVHDDHRAPFPGFARLFVSDAAPDVDNLLSALVRTAGPTQLAATGKVFGKRCTHALEPAT